MEQGRLYEVSLALRTAEADEKGWRRLVRWAEKPVEKSKVERWQKNKDPNEKEREIKQQLKNLPHTPMIAHSPPHV